MAAIRQVTFSELRALCPTRWEDLSLDAFQKIYTHWELDKEPHERDYFKLLCILSGQPFREINPTPEKEIAVYELTRWVNEQPSPFTKELPDTIEIAGKTITVPKNVEELSIGQMIVGLQIVSKATYVEECISMAIAVLVQPLYDEAKFDFARAKELEKEIRKMNAVKAYPVGFFFAQSCPKAWEDAGKLLQANPKQPKSDARANVAAMAEVGRLNAFSNLFLIGDYAARFGLDPDEVFWKTGFKTVINFTCAYKERDEFNERFYDIWQTLNDTSTESK